jgi:hypothetical protein
MISLAASSYRGASVDSLVLIMKIVTEVIWLYGLIDSDRS